MSVKAAVKLFNSFRERKPRRIGKVNFKVPSAVACMGYVEGIDYRTTHGKKVTLYHHDFAPGSRPLLAVSADGSQLLLLGGHYQFTERGIVDKDAAGREVENTGHGEAINPRHIITISELKRLERSAAKAGFKLGSRQFAGGMRFYLWSPGHEEGDKPLAQTRIGASVQDALNMIASQRKGNPRTEDDNSLYSANLPSLLAWAKSQRLTRAETDRMKQVFRDDTAYYIDKGWESLERASRIV